MKILTVITAIVMSVFSTAVMSYISMAIPIGPWIAPTLALCGIIVFRLFCSKSSQCSDGVALSTIAGSVGGILSTAIGFYFTTLYFLDETTFSSWMAHPVYFSVSLGLLSLSGGLFGIWVANLFEDKLIVKDDLSFPIGQMVYKTISAQKQIRRGIELIVGFFSTFLFCFLQDGLWRFEGIIRKSVVLISSRTYTLFSLPLLKVPQVSLDFWPMLWALGFITGHVVAVPLLIGVLSKMLLVHPLFTMFVYAAQKSGTVAPNWWGFIITFCSGMVLAGAVFGFVKTPQVLLKTIKKMWNKTQGKESIEKESLWKHVGLVETTIVLISVVACLTYFKFSWVSQIYIILFTFICTYQLAIIAGKIGLAPMGKFATFVMVPAMFLFRTTPVQTVVIALFVGVCGGVVADILFGRKLGHLAQLSPTQVKRYQYLGLIVSVLVIGILFWLLINHFHLGSDQLIAIRAQNRWLLIDALKNLKTLNYYVIIPGFVFGFILHKFKINSLLVLGGLFMPVNITLGLVVGGVGALFVRDKERWYPFWSGVYASNSIWMLIRAMF